jgi:hypothetical protein
MLICLYTINSLSRKQACGAGTGLLNIIEMDVTDILEMVHGLGRDRGSTNRRVGGSIPAGVIGFFIDIILRSHYGPGVYSASNRNEYQEHLLGVKAASA